MYVLILLIIFFLGVNIFINKGQIRYNWFICSVLLLSSSIILIQKPQIPVHRFFLICYWLSILNNKETKKLKMPLKIPMILYLIGFLVVGCESHYLSFFYMIYKPLIHFFDTYFVILLGFIASKKIKVISKPIIDVLFFVTVYGIFTYIIKENPIQELICQIFNIGYDHSYYWESRVRVDSTWSGSISYGFICSMFFYLLLSHLRSRKEIYLLILLLINLMLSGSRTDIVTFFLMGFVLIVIKYNMKKSFVIFLISVIVVFVCYNTIPIVYERINNVSTTIQGKDNVEGSSIELRNNQTSAVLLLFIQSPIVGHGIDYITEEMGFGTNQWEGDSLYKGFESLVYIIMIERGLVGLFSELLIVLSILFYALKYLKQDKNTVANIVLLILAFIFFAISTGALDIWLLVMFYIGLYIRKIHDERTCNNYTCL